MQYIVSVIDIAIIDDILLILLPFYFTLILSFKDF